MVDDCGRNPTLEIAERLPRSWRSSATGSCDLLAGARLGTRQRWRSWPARRPWCRRRRPGRSSSHCTMAGWRSTHPRRADRVLRSGRRSHRTVDARRRIREDSGARDSRSARGV